MTLKYERQCWGCQGKDLEDMGAYVKCRSCGATYNYVPKPGNYPITEVDLVTGGAPKPGSPTRSKPRGAK